jgi:D-serine deaminase-like pyridoxal phosphate-dependent protein
MGEASSIRRPTIVLDEEKCKSNIQFMAEKAQRSNVNFRPHFKTHQSLEIGQWFKDYGVNKICVSSVEMASFFAPEWDDITIAFPLNILEIEQINQLVAKISLNVLLESEESIDFLEKNLSSSCGFFIKIDVGYHRTGITPDKLADLERIVQGADHSELLNFKGFLAHSGHTYLSHSIDEVEAIYKDTLNKLTRLKSHFIQIYPNLIISVGDTPSCSVVNDFSGVDEIRPGNFVFYDLIQHSLGSNDISQIAVAVACPIVAIHEDREEIVIYGGAVHFSKDFLETSADGRIFGRVVEKNNETWGNVIPGMILKKLSQEHGTVNCPKASIKNYSLGQLLYILPAHSCLTADKFSSYLTIKGREISKYH